MKEAKPSFYRKNILPLLLRNKVIHFLGFGNRLAFDPIPSQLQVVLNSLFILWSCLMKFAQHFRFEFIQTFIYFKAFIRTRKFWKGVDKVQYELRNGLQRYMCMCKTLVQESSKRNMFCHVFAHPTSGFRTLSILNSALMC